MIEEKTKVPNRMPLSFTPEFIGRLIEMRKAFKRQRNKPVVELLNQAVQQCRIFNGDPETPKEQIWPYMVQTQKHLARLGVMVG